MRSALRLFVVLGLLSVLPFSAADAQMVGATGGLTVASAEGDDVPETLDSRTSFNVGIFASFPITDRLSVVPGAYYVEKGAETQDGLQTKLNYVEFPLLVNYRLVTGATYGVGVFAGPSIAFEAQCFQEVTFQEDGQTLTGDVECEDLDPPFETKSVDIGAMGGVGITFEVGARTLLVVNGGVDYGLTTIDDSAQDLDLRNLAFFVNAGLAWTFGR